MIIQACINAIITHLEENGLQCNTPRQEHTWYTTNDWVTYVINPFIGIKDQPMDDPCYNKVWYNNRLSPNDNLMWQIPHSTLGPIYCNKDYITIYTWHTTIRDNPAYIIFPYYDLNLFDNILKIFQQDLQNYINPIDHSERFKAWASIN